MAIGNVQSSFQGLANGGGGFSSPWLDAASLAMPTQIREVLYLTDFVWHCSSTYRRAQERIVAYFLTGIDIGAVSTDNPAGEDEKEKYRKCLEDTLDILSVMQDLDLDRACFHGDTRAVTDAGVFPLRELAGRTVNVLSEGGVYRPAFFRSYGRQELLEVTFSDGRTLLATAEHQWVAQNCSGKMVRVPTTTLKAGYHIPRVVAPRPEKNEDFYEGVCHGFCFGDGSLYNGGKQCAAYFHGAKIEDMLPYFEGHGCPPRQGRRSTRIHGLPAYYKQLPANSQSASYWYGFVCGFLAADGSVDTYGCALLTQKSKTVLDAIAIQLPRLGMVAGPVRGHFRHADLSKQQGKPAHYYGEMHYVTLLKQCMLPQDFLRPRHRENFEANFRSSKYGQMVGVQSVLPTGLTEEVFCCVEPETHTFVVDNGVLTGNCYGNSFASFVVPFRRLLVCKKCGQLAPLSEIRNNKKYGFRWQKFEFMAKCPKCGYDGPWKCLDQPDDLENRIQVKRWSPHEIEIIHDTYTNESCYVWRMPSEYKESIRRGDEHLLERCPKEVLQAVKHDQLFRFHKDVIFHMKESTRAGIKARGWGIPRILTNFRDIWYVQVLRRYNEAIALDYIIPFRLITPAPRGGAGGAAGGATVDPLLSMNMGDFRAQVEMMLRRRRRDPASWNVLGFPVQYQALGGDAQQLAPKDLLDQGIDIMLNAGGAPAELFRGTLQVQAAPMALRLFEADNHNLVHDNNALLSWAVKQISSLLGWETVKATMRKVTIADDVQKSMLVAQMVMGQMVSQTTGLRTLGLEFKDEQRQIAEESRFSQKMQAEVQEEMEQNAFGEQVAKGQGGQPAGPGGQPGQPGGQPGAQGGDPSQGGQQQSPVGAMMSSNQPTTPEDMLSAANALAQQLLGLPESQKDSELRQLKQKNSVLHAITKRCLEDIRNRARTAGASMLLNQQGGQPQQQ